MEATAGEDDHQDGHERAGDREEGAQRDLDAGVADDQENGHEDNHPGGESLPNGSSAGAIHGEQGLVEHDRLGAFPEDRQERQGGQCPYAPGGHGGLRLVLDVGVPGADRGFREHPVGGEQEHDHGHERHDALEDLLVGGGRVVEHGEQDRNDSGGDQAQNQTQVDQPDPVLEPRLDEVGDDGGDHEDRLEPLTKQDEEGLSEGAGEEGPYGVHLASARIERASVLSDHVLETLGLSRRIRVPRDHGLANYLELVLDLGDAVSGDDGHDGLLKTELLVVAVVGLVYQFRPALSVAGPRLLDRLVDEAAHLGGDLRPAALPTPLVDVGLLGVELGTFGGCGRRLLSGVVAGASKIGHAVKLRGIGGDVSRQRRGLAG